MSSDLDTDFDYEAIRPIVPIDIWLPKITSSLSVLGSYVIIREVLADRKRGSNKRSTSTLGPILVSMSIGDILFSAATFLTTWPAPRDLTYLDSTNIGNQATCTAQGLVACFGSLVSVFFNCSLALSFYLIVRYNWNDQRIRALSLKLHIAIYSFATSAAIVPLPFEAYNNSYFQCGPRAYPMDCQETWLYGDEANCTRGDNASIILLFLFVAPFFIAMFTACTLMFLIYRAVRHQEAKNAKYDFTNSTLQQEHQRQLSVVDHDPSSQVSRNASASFQRQNPTVVIDRKRSVQVGVQGMYYISAFILTFLLVDVSIIVTTFGIITDRDVLDTIAFSFLLPLQGVFNMLVFARTREMKTPEGRLARKILCFSCNLGLLDHCINTSPENVEESTVRPNPPCQDVSTPTPEEPKV